MAKRKRSPGNNFSSLSSPPSAPFKKVARTSKIVQYTPAHPEALAQPSSSSLTRTKPRAINTKRWRDFSAEEKRQYSAEKERLFYHGRKRRAQEAANEHASKRAGERTFHDPTAEARTGVNARAIEAEHRAAEEWRARYPNEHSPPPTPIVPTSDPQPELARSLSTDLQRVVRGLAALPYTQAIENMLPPMLPAPVPGPHPVSARRPQTELERIVREWRAFLYPEAHEHSLLPRSTAPISSSEPEHRVFAVPPAPTLGGDSGLARLLPPRPSLNPRSWNTAYFAAVQPSLDIGPERLEHVLARLSLDGRHSPPASPAPPLPSLAE